MAQLTVIEFPAEPAAFDIEAQAEFVAAGASGDTFLNDGKTALYVKNASGGPITLTIIANRACSSGELHDSTPSIPDGFAGFVAMKLRNDRYNTRFRVAQITYSSATDIEVAAVRLPI